MWEDVEARLAECGYLDIYRHSTADARFPSFFHNPRGIHGVAHARRVLLLSMILACQQRLGRADTDILVKASLYHDIGRTHDGICLEHGKNSFEKMMRLGLAGGGPGEENEILRYVMENHCLPDDAAARNITRYKINNKRRAVSLLWLFKDSDGLDRVRIGDLDIKYLRNPAAKQLAPLARWLLEEIK